MLRVFFLLAHLPIRRVEFLISVITRDKCFELAAEVLVRMRVIL